MAKYMAYMFMYKQVRAEVRGGGKYTLAFWKFPCSIQPDFKYNGRRCSEYDLIMIPFVVVCDNIDGALEEVLCKFSVSGKFVFALYVNMNELSVSPDFIDGSKCPDLLSKLSRFPFLSYDEAHKQIVIIKGLHRREDGEEKNSECVIRRKDVVVDVDI